ncbi:MAG: argininosuccinate lyase [Campylobacterales bacterium]|nr:argininosuccinate lyase [Campylobacterales bacterium]
MKKMWSGRFKEPSSKLLEEFNASIFFDKALYKEDIQGSIIHSKMLCKQGILTEQEQADIEKGLGQVREEIENGTFQWLVEDEDIHMSIEKRLTEIIGDAGKKLHTARSRNDQVALDFRLFCLANSETIRDLLKSLVGVLTDIARDHKETMLPGMTHLQHAQPISFAYHMLAYASMFKRDFERFESLMERNNFSPIGCAALAGTPHNIDRHFTAENLGFNEPTVNCLDTVSDRDFALDLLYAISVAFVHMSRLSEELIIWSSSEFGFVTISDAHSTGSSIMPNKKNPDVAELIRGKTGRVNGNLVSLLTVMKALPLAYNKDMQEDKEGVFDSVKTAKISIEILTEMLACMTINKENQESACKKGHLSATDLADFLAANGVPFREAHFITGRAVAVAEDKGVDLSELTFEDLKSIDDRVSEEVVPLLNLRNSMNARKSYGGTAVEAVEKQISYFDGWLTK